MLLRKAWKKKATAVRGDSAGASFLSYLTLVLGLSFSLLGKHKVRQSVSHVAIQQGSIPGRGKSKYHGARLSCTRNSKKASVLERCVSLGKRKDVLRGTEGQIV